MPGIQYFRYLFSITNQKRNVTFRGAFISNAELLSKTSHRKHIDIQNFEIIIFYRSHYIGMKKGCCRPWKKVVHSWEHFVCVQMDFLLRSINHIDILEGL